MTWADLAWPDLAPDFPEPSPSEPPPPFPEDAPPRIADEVARRERNRALAVQSAVAAGAVLACGGIGAYGRAPLAVTAELLGAALAVGAVGSAALALLVGPNWRQRRQHYALVAWERDRAAWLARERARYLSSLPPQQQARLHDALARRRDERGLPHL